MAHYVLKDAGLYFGAYDISGDSNAMNLNYTAAELDDTCFGDTGKVTIAGMKKAALTHDGIMDVENSDYPLFGKVSQSDTLVIAVPKDNSTGEAAYFFQAQKTGYTIGASVGELQKFSATATGSDGCALINGTILHRGQITGASNSSGIELGAVSASQYVYGGLSVYADDGSTLVVKIQSCDTELGTYTDRVTFTSTDTITSEWSTPLAGAETDTWWRAQWTFTGTSFDMIVVMGIA